MITCLSKYGLIILLLIQTDTHMKEVQTLNRHANVTVSHGLFGPPIGVSNWGRPVIGDLWSANSFANQKLGSPGSVAIVI
jgi:hypothetical protein